jgi:outer membrane protein assembly factor BamB
VSKVRGVNPYADKAGFMKKYKFYLLLILAVLIGILIIYYDTNTFDSFPISTLNDTVWEVKVNNNDSLVSQPQIYDGNLYIQTETEVIAYNTSTGKLLWRSPLLEEVKPGSITIHPLIIDQLRIVVQSQQTIISVLNRETGKPIWNTNVPSEYSTVEDMVVEKDKVIVSNYDSDISAYDIVDGSFVWSNSNVPSRTGLELFPFENKLILGTFRALTLYDIDNGQMLDSHNLEGDVDAYSLDGDHLFIVFDSGKCIFSSLDLKNMENDWCVTPSYDFLLNNMEMVYDNENLYVFGNKMYGINKETGATLWEAKPQDVFKYPIIIGDSIYITDANYLYKMNKNSGSKTAKIKIMNQETAVAITTQSKWAPIITSNLIVMFYDGGIIAYNNSIK